MSVTNNKLFRSAIDELKVLIEDDNVYNRRAFLQAWLRNHVKVVKPTQLIFNKRIITTEHHDYICDTLVHRCLDEVIEANCVEFEIGEKEYSAEMIFFKRKK